MDSDAFIRHITLLRHAAGLNLSWIHCGSTFAFTKHRDSAQKIIIPLLCVQGLYEHIQSLACTMPIRAILLERIMAEDHQKGQVP
jgi:hypothetical protein